MNRRKKRSVSWATREGYNSRLDLFCRVPLNRYGFKYDAAMKAAGYPYVDVFDVEPFEKHMSWVAYFSHVEAICNQVFIAPNGASTIYAAGTTYYFLNEEDKTKFLLLFG